MLSASSYLQNIRIPREPQLRFDANGTLRQTELIIINCRWDENIANQKKWQKVRTSSKSVGVYSAFARRQKSNSYCRL